uniref:Uncharacterized protein n=1 Tax=Anguilla anguilla TaxID=7936 RepID=A0A0E9T1R9_ANGAN
MTVQRKQFHLIQRERERERGQEKTAQ